MCALDGDDVGSNSGSNLNQLLALNKLLHFSELQSMELLDWLRKQGFVLFFSPHLL